MTVLTAGHLNVTPVRVTTTLSSRALAAAMRKSQYSLELFPGRGWGRLPIEDGDLEIEGDALRLNPGNPAANSSLLGRPAVLASLIVDRLRRRRTALPARLTEEEEKRFLFEPVPFGVLALESDTDDGIHTYDVLIGTSNASDAGLVIPELEKLVGGGDGDGGGSVEANKDFAPDADLFLWLLSKTGGQPSLTPDLTLDALRSLQARDSRDRKSRYLDWPDVQRREVMANVTDSSCCFGPAKMVLSDTSLGLDVDWMLNPDGSFSLFVGNSEYDSGDLNTPRGRLRLLQDMTYVVIPKLLGAYRADRSWDSSGRAAFRDACSASLRSLVAVPCSNCGHI